MVEETNTPNPQEVTMRNITVTYQYGDIAKVAMAVVGWVADGHCDVVRDAVGAFVVFGDGSTLRFIGPSALQIDSAGRGEDPTIADHATEHAVMGEPFDFDSV